METIKDNKEIIVNQINLLFNIFGKTMYMKNFHFTVYNVVINRC